MTCVPKKESYVWVTKRNNGHNPYLVFTFLTSVLFLKKRDVSTLVFVFFTTCKKIYKHLYIKNIKNTSRNPEKLPMCHCIGKIMKYPWISPKFTKMPLAARVAHARLLLEEVKLSGEISGQKMVASGRSEGEDSDGGGLDGR